MTYAFTTSQVEEMKTLHEQGKGTREIAIAFSCGCSTVAKVLTQTGADMSSGKKIAIKMKGKKTRLGAKHSEQTKALMSESRMGRPGTRFGPPSAETRAKISAGTKGKNTRYTPEKRLEVEQMRARLKRLLRRTLNASGARKTTPSETALGYSKHELLAHLGPKPSPDSEVDHYVPVTEFFRRGIFEPSTVNALCNLRWLASEANKKKGNSVPADADAVIAACGKRTTYLKGLPA